jgi:hypothetical protein
VSDICVVHLVWEPLGQEPLERFVASYRRHSAGIEHRVLLAFKEFRDPVRLEEARAAVAGIPHESVEMPEPMLDLIAYPELARRAGSRHLFCVNSNSEILAPGWLAKMHRHITTPGIGLVGATASYESISSQAPLITRPLRARQFPRFPNPHVRTNAFMMERETMLRLDWGHARSKTAAWKVESGTRSITRQVWEQGLDALVVGRDGVGYPRERFPESETFRRGTQANLLVADNRTRDYDAAGEARRRELTAVSWGDAAPA